MPWTKPMEQRYAFVTDYLSGRFTMAALCRRYGVSRKTGYKWAGRFRARGREGLEELSRRPLGSPLATSNEVAEALLEVRRQRPTWGPKKICAYLARERRDLTIPSIRTVGRLLKKAGLVDATKPRRRYQRSRSKKELAPGDTPNDVWCIDFKGDFRLHDGTRCYPLTITDHHTRYLITCRALGSTHLQPVQEALKRAFKAYGLPRYVRSDNGAPFGAEGVHGLSKLSVWLIRLGIEPEHIQPGRPDQNGRHERMHRTLKAETTRPPRKNRIAQQKAFNRFQHDYNEVRPHEALDFLTPSACYEPSDRQLKAPSSPEYPGYYETRQIKPKGHFRWKGTDVFVGAAFRGEPVGLHEIDDGVWIVSYGSRELGVLDERLLVGATWTKLLIA